MASLIAILVLLGVMGWLLSGRAVGRPRAAPHDEEALADAEAEVQDLDAFGSSEDADDQLPDWGPGAPKPD